MPLPPRLAGAHLALGRVNTGERDQDIAVLRGNFGHFLVFIAAKPGLALRIDGKYHRRDILFAVMRGGLLDGWRMAPRRAEIFGHRGLQIVIAVIAMTTARLLGMGVNIYRPDLAGIDHLLNSKFKNYTRTINALSSS